MSYIVDANLEARARSPKSDRRSHDAAVPADIASGI